MLFDYGFVLGDAELSFLDDLIDRLGDMTADLPEDVNKNQIDAEEDTYNE